VGPWVIALIGVLVVAAGLAIPIKGPGGISNNRDGDPAPRRSAPVIVGGFAVVAVGVLFAWQPWGAEAVQPAAAGSAPRTATASKPAPSGIDASGQSATPQFGSGTSGTAAASSGGGAGTAGGATAQAWIKDLDFSLPASYYGSSELDLSKPAGGNKIDPNVSALSYANGYSLASGTYGDVFGYAVNQPASAADCLAQGQQHALTKLSTVLSSTPTNVPLLKKNDAFCVSDKAGYVAWMHYVGPTPNDMQGNMELQFKITIWKPGS
jgi:hypothetical protein